MSGWVELICTYDETEAQMIRDILESENIEVSYRSLKITPYPVSIGRLGEVKILVRSDDLEKAKSLLKIMTDTGGNEFK